MVNRLWVQLTLAFVVVIIVTVTTTAWFANQRAGNQFRAYLRRPDILARSGLPDLLVTYYQDHDSWDGVTRWLDGDGRGNRPDRRAKRGEIPPFVVADATGHIVYADGPGRQGQTLGALEQSSAQSLTVDSHVVGYLVWDFASLTSLALPELDFLHQLRISLLLAGLLAAGLGIGFSLFISRTLAAPLAVLARTARAFAAQDWNQRVAVQDQSSIAEVAEVAHAFNDMAGALQQAETLRRHLIADVAHELRTPLSVLQGNLNAMLDGLYPLDMQEIATLYDQTRLLTRLVDDLHELAQAEAGQLPLHLTAVEADTLLWATATRFNTVADAQAITIEVSVPAFLPPVQADPDRMIQVLHNLISNALRHTPTGGRVTIVAVAEESAHRVRFSVNDTGEGIAAEDLPHIFERFYRADKSRASSRGGAGLGLTIAKTLVEAMGGTIGVESTVGQGSHFWFTLPIVATE